jgi:hypothetical protein
VAAQPEDGSRVAEHLDLRIELSGSLDLNGGFMKRVALTAVVSSLLTLALVYGLGAAPPMTRRTVLENARVEVIERSIPPGEARDAHTRPTDQVIVFLNDVSYDRIDPKTGETISRSRKAGEVIWHSRGEAAPKLVNTGSSPFRSLVISLKDWDLTQ